MCLKELQDRLVDLARLRVASGLITERSLARLCRLSQPHMHNVLKRIRFLSFESADRLMQALGVTIPELFWRFPNQGDLAIRAVPVIRSRIGPGSDTALDAYSGYMPFPSSLLDPTVSPLAARLAPDLVMPKAVLANDLVLLDQSPERRLQPRNGDLYVVHDGSGYRVRYVRLGPTRVYIGNEATMGDPDGWHGVHLQGRNILDIVRARIVWIGRKVEENPAGPVEEIRKGDRSLE